MTERRTFLVTGVTGFLGKVVLEELVRRREELAVARVHVVIRPKGDRPAAERFQREVADSPCFANLPKGWTDLVDVVEADLEQPGLRLGARAAELESNVTHVVHAAASVSFDLPVAQATQANVMAALNVLDFAKRCNRMQRMVAVSTAYVSQHGQVANPVPEALAPLPMPASDILQAILDGSIPERELLRRSGHPNTYTLTKSVAEHLLLERRGHVPVTVVRPSVISASLHHPVPGWIDSTAAFAGFVLMLGLGHLRAVVGHGHSKLDVVPVDEVAHRILAASVADGPPAAIRHATAGAALSATLQECWEGIRDYYRANRVGRRPSLRYMGPRRLAFRLADVLHHQLPTTMASLRGPRVFRKARSLRARLDKLNDAFPYFTSNSFAFHSSVPLGNGFEPHAYVRLVCQGIHRHVLRQDRTQWLLAGAQHPGHDGDLAWALRQPHGNAWIRLASWRAGKVLARTHDRVTVDLPSFEAARRSVPEDAAIVLVGSHRSYLDFVLVSYLAFARPDLRIPIPHIAATMEFGKLPVLGRILRSMHAFYLQRGGGKEDPDLTLRIHRLVAEGKALEFFIEGTRSRTREFLEPKRGLLRALQATGRPIAILPVALTYDRVPEESAFLTELLGGPKPPMRLGDLLRWAWRVRRRQVALGRAHVACAAPVLLTPGSDVPAVATQVVDRLREATVTTTFHLEAFVHHHGPVRGLDAAGLRAALERKGRRVLDSDLGGVATLDPVIAGTFRHHFIDWLDPEATLPRVDVVERPLVHLMEKPRVADPTSAADPGPDELTPAT